MRTVVKGLSFGLKGLFNIRQRKRRFTNKMVSWFSSLEEIGFQTEF